MSHKITWSERLLGSALYAILFVVGYTLYRFYFKGIDSTLAIIAMYFIYMTISFYVVDFVGERVKQFVQKRNEREHQ
jgi:hypothetical protein